MFCFKIYFLESEPVGAELLSVEPEPKKKSGAEAKEKWFSSATLVIVVNFLKKKLNHNPQFAVKKSKGPTYELNGCENNFNSTWY